MLLTYPFRAEKLANKKLRLLENERHRENAKSRRSGIVNSAFAHPAQCWAEVQIILPLSGLCNALLTYTEQHCWSVLLWHPLSSCEMMGVVHAATNPAGENHHHRHLTCWKTSAGNYRPHIKWILLLHFQRTENSDPADTAVLPYQGTTGSRHTDEMQGTLKYFMPCGLAASCLSLPGTSLSPSVAIQIPLSTFHMSKATTSPKFLVHFLPSSLLKALHCSDTLNLAYEVLHQDCSVCSSGPFAIPSHFTTRMGPFPSENPKE